MLLGGPSLMANLSSYPGAFDVPTDTFTGATSMAGVHAQHHDLLADAIYNMQRISGQVFSVRASAYGAAGDGVTDDTAAIQAAIDAAAAAGGGTVYFPKGTYASGRLTVNSNGISIAGAGSSQSVLMAKSGITTTDLIRVNTTGDLTGATRLTSFALHDLRLDGSNVNVANAGITSLIAIYCVDRVRVSNVYVYNAYGSCLDLCGCTKTWVGGGTVIDTLRPGTPFMNGLNIYGNDNFINDHGYGDHTVQGVHVVGVPTVGIFCGGDGSGRLNVSGCTVRGAAGDAGYGIFAEVGVVPSSDVTITGNYVESKVNGIGMSNSGTVPAPFGSRCTVTGNTVRNCDYGVTVTEKMMTVVGNVVTDANVGIFCGVGHDYEESDWVIANNIITLRPGAAGQGLVMGPKLVGTQFIRRVVIDGNSINGDPQPGIVTAALVLDSTSAQVNAGTHVYGVSFVTAVGESQVSPISGPVTADGTHTKVAVNNIPIGPTGVTSRKLYRSTAGTTTLKVLATIANNTATTYTDIIADASLGAAPPTRGASNTGDGIYMRSRIKDVEIRGNEVSGMGLSGIHLEANNGSPSEIKIDGNRLWDNGYRLVGGNQNGVWVEAGCDQVHITNNRIYDSGGGTQTLGIQNTGTATNLVVEGNRINQTTTAAIAAATTGYIQGRGGYTLTDASTVTPDTLKGDVAHWTIAANAARTVAAPTGIGATTGSRFTLVVKNGIGGATAFTAANLTFNAIFKKNGAFPATNIADTKTRTISFEYDGTNWVETGRVDADV